MSLSVVHVISEHLDRENSTAQLLCLCDWPERLNQAASLVGGLQFDSGGSGSYYQPQEYPYGSGLYCNGVEIKPVGDFDFSNGGYKQAELTVSYGALKLLDPTGTDGIDICQLTTNVSAEMLPLPSQKFRWSNSGTELDPTLDIKPSMVDPYIELSVKVVFGATPKLADLTSLVGLVNSVTLYVADGSFEEDTVLLLGADLEQCVNVQGQPAWVRNLKFGIRNNDGLGWNGLWNPNSQAYEGIETVNSGDPPYASGDLSILFNIS